MNGLLNLLKPSGMTSHDCVAVLRNLTGVRKIGHGGTLDPNACGVLPLCVGPATRVIEFMDHLPKAYRCELLLGLETDTLDVWGKLLADRRGTFTPPSQEEVYEALASFSGTIDQRPPAFSAVKVAGKRLYSYAREGVQVQAEKRQVTLHELIPLAYEAEAGRLLFDVRCSKGTYIRSLCQDLGRKLGMGAAMSFLLRTESSGLHLADAFTFEELKALDRRDLAQVLLPLSHALDWMSRLRLSEERAALFLLGNPAFSKGMISVEPDASQEARLRAVYYEQKLLGVASVDDRDSYVIRKVLR